MSLTFQNIEVKNFVSFGNITQQLNLNTKDMSLILGENVDSDSTDHRNGTGKSSIINAISYALFGKPLVSIRLDNLINKTNERGMEVSISFVKNGVSYRIERGRRPNKLLFFQESTCINDQDSDESQGENRKTQIEIERVLGINHEMFKNIVVLNTYSEPFLSMPAAAQRSFIESLLGISILSEKAEVLKEQIRTTKDSITEEEFRIKAVVEANKTIENNITRLAKQSDKWDDTHKKELVKLTDRIKQLEKVNIDDEITLHKQYAEYEESSKNLARYKRQLTRLEKEKSKLAESIEKNQADLKKAEAHECHACGQSIHDDNHQRIISKLQGVIDSMSKDAIELEDEYVDIKAKVDGLIVEKPTAKLVYDKIDDAYRHSTIIDNLRESLEKEKNSENPYVDQIKSLTDEGLKEVNYDTLNDLTRIKDHQDFLLKLLTNNQSFIRKEIIDQNLGYLNARLEFYLSSVGLPHQVQFQNDLDVHISEYGRDLDFDNLSRGERTRLILALSWSFRDVYESLNGKINLLFIDELLDNGLDTSGAENGLRILKEMNRRMHRDIFLITHREEMHGRVDSIVKVLKRNGFSSFDINGE